jgi:glycerophosphoryl diester phosphodiesterase
MSPRPLPARVLAVALLLALASPVHAIDLQGHRGARGLAPENTLPAFALALGLGVHTLEMDVGVTRDGVVVVSHDAALNPDLTRGPDGQFIATRGPAIANLSFDELQRFDVGRLRPGSAYAARYPAQAAVDGTRIPRLADVFALVRKSGNERVRLSIETKLTPANDPPTLAPEPFARALIAAIREAGMAARCTVQSFDWRTLAIVQREAPEIATAYLSAQQSGLDNIGAGRPDGSAWTAGVQYRTHGSVPKMVQAAGGRIWSPFHRDLDAAALAEAHALGLTVLAWTVNTPDDIERVLSLGVDGLISDRPDLVREALRRRGQALPEPTPVKP